MEPDVERIIESVLRQHYLVREPPSFLRIVNEIRAECAASGYRPPTRRAIKSRVDAMDQREVMQKRKGAKAARQAFEPRVGGLDVERPLEVVQIDHTLADIILVDQFEGKPLGRPWLTLEIDVATRVVLCAYVSFDTFSVLSIGLCLHHCVRTKSIRAPQILEKFYWSAAGIPQAVHVDNGRDFRSDAFQLACADGSVEYRPPGRAHHGGHIERLIGTTMRAVHVLPGTTQSSPKDTRPRTATICEAQTLNGSVLWLICRRVKYRVCCSSVAQDFQSNVYPVQTFSIVRHVPKSALHLSASLALQVYGYLRQSFATRGPALNPSMTGMLCSLLFIY